MGSGGYKIQNRGVEGSEGRGVWYNGRMLNDVPYAELYKLMPVEEPSAHVVIGDVRWCGTPPTGSPPMTFSQLLMEQIGKVLKNDDIVGYGGITGGAMMIIVKVSKERCHKLLDDALLAVHKIFEKNPKIIPVGGVGFELRDWDDIPDSEKAGHKK